MLGGWLGIGGVVAFDTRSGLTVNSCLHALPSEIPPKGHLHQCDTLLLAHEPLLSVPLLVLLQWATHKRQVEIVVLALVFKG